MYEDKLIKENKVALSLILPVIFVGRFPPELFRTAFNTSKYLFVKSFSTSLLQYINDNDSDNLKRLLDLFELHVNTETLSDVLYGIKGYIRYGYKLYKLDLELLSDEGEMESISYKLFYYTLLNSIRFY